MSADVDPTRNENSMKVLIAVDGSESAWDAVHFAAELLAPTDQAIVINVTSAVDPTVVPAGGLAGYAAAGYAIPGALADRSDDEALASSADDPVAHAIADEAAAALQTDSSVVETGGAVDRIVSYAKDAGADLIVVGTRDPSWFDRILTGGSISREVVNRAHCSVLVVR